jgi:hypothetical protein
MAASAHSAAGADARVVSAEVVPASVPKDKLAKVRVHYVVAGSGRVEIALQRRARGYRVGNLCLLQQPQLRTAPPCFLFVPLRRLVTEEQTGPQTVPLLRLLPGARLAVGSYRLRLRALGQAARMDASLRVLASQG